MPRSAAYESGSASASLPLIEAYLHRQAAVVEVARDILRDADAWGLKTPRIEALRSALEALDMELGI